MNTCTVEGCDKPVKARRLCASHHTLMLRAKDPERHKAYAKRYRQENAEKLRAQRKSWNARHPEFYRWHHLAHTYQMTREVYLALLESQNGRCAICSSDNPGKGRASFCVDHDHACCDAVPTCGRCTRGLLCLNCNNMIGIARDDAVVLQRAINYLNRHDRKAISQ